MGIKWCHYIQKHATKQSCFNTQNISRPNHVVISSPNKSKQSSDPIHQYQDKSNDNCANEKLRFFTSDQIKRGQKNMRSFIVQKAKSLFLWFYIEVFYH